MIERYIDEEMILMDEVSDEALEAAALVALGRLPTIMYRTYCFACPSDPLRLPKLSSIINQEFILVNQN
jgi:hypothetical protein